MSLLDDIINTKIVSGLLDRRRPLVDANPLQGFYDSAPAGSVMAPGGLLANPMSTPIGPEASADQKMLGLLSFAPVIGDAAGLAADALMYRDQPETRTLGNYALTALGALPFVPSVAGATVFQKLGLLDPAPYKLAINEFEPFDPSVKYKARDRIIEMSIDDFLSMAKSGEGSYKAEKVNSLISSGKRFKDVPFLNVDIVDGVAKVGGHEGRHRARALRDMGYTHMPVRINTRDPGIRWSEQRPGSFDYVENWPLELVSETGNKTIDFPVTRENAAIAYSPASLR